MSKNINQIYSGNSTIGMQSTDLLYIGRSNVDMAIQYSNLAKAIGTSLTATGYTTISSATNVTLTNSPAAYYRVSFSTTGKTLTLPPANAATSMPVGSSILVVQNGTNSFDILDNAGGGYGTINPGDKALVTLTDNSTAAGGYVINYLAGAPPILTGFHYISSLGYFNPAITNGCTIVQRESTTNKNNFRMLQFASGVTNIAIAQIPLESSIDKSSVYVKPIWQTNTATSGNIVWYIDSIFRKNGDAFDTAYGTQQTITTGASSPAGIINIGSAVSVSPSNPSGSAGTAGVLELRLQRKTGDTIADSVNLIDVEVGLTIKSGSDQI